MSGPVVIAVAVESDLDEAVARKLIAQVGGASGTIYGKNGKDHIRLRIAGFNNAAQHSPGLCWWTSTMTLIAPLCCVMTGCQQARPSNCASVSRSAPLNPG